jgi:hypothetical protein
MERYIGEIKIMKDPKFEDIQILWMTNEQWRDPLNKYNPNRNFPSVWFIYEGIMYWALSKYEFKWFEDYSDLTLPSTAQFNQWFPGKEEWEFMLGFGYEYREFDYEKAILHADDLDYWCDFEIRFLTEWNRNKKIDDLLK